MELPRFFIYGLVDPRDRQLRYVGKSSSGVGRPRRHKYLPKKGRLTHKQAWLRGLLDSGFMFEICILKVSTAASLSSDEVEVIARYRSLGYRLTNLTNGGDGATGYVPTEEARARMSAVAKGKPKSPEHVLAAATAKRGKKMSLEARRNISNGRKGKGGRPVIDQTGATFPSIKLAAEALGLKRPHISMVLSGALKHTKGYIFRYATERG